MKLSIVIPCYNEIETINRILKRVEAADIGPVEKEIVIVDDFSTDGTRELLKSNGIPYKVIFHEKNKGKGYALRTGFEHVTGDVVIIQDADLEYDPNDYKQLIEPIFRGECQVMYGSRDRKENKLHSGAMFYAGGKVVTWVTNILYGSRLTDEPTCYKVFSRELLQSIPLKCERFEFCPEITAKILKRGIKIRELPISYYPRKVSEGKKINWKDGVEAIWTLIKYRFTD